MFKLNAAPIFTVDVSLTTPGADSQTLKLAFRHKRKTELKDYIARVEAAQAANDSEATDKLALEAVSGWNGAIGASGAVTEFSPEAFREMCEEYPMASAEIIRAYLAAITEGRAKN